MSLSNTIKVAMPKEKITFKKGTKDTIYVYYTVRSYRRKSDNKPTSDEVAIGKKDLETGMLIPNNKYYEIFNIDQSVSYTPSLIQTFGTFYFLDAIANKINLISDLSDVFKDKWKYLLTIAFYMVTRNNTMKYVNYWCEENYNYLASPLISQRISEIFASITEKERLDFFKKWSKRIKDNEYIAYDVTSISSYSKMIDNVSYGYNRDGEDLPQINLGMYTGEKTKLPIFYNVYNGSITDKEHLIFMMKYTKELGIDNIKFVMDKGFYKKDNLNYMYNNNYKFIICLSNSYTFVKEYIDKVKDSIKLASNWNNKHQLYSMCMQYKQDDKICNIHIIYNPEKQVDEEKIIYSTIEKLEQELKSLISIPEKLTKFEKYFDLKIQNNMIEYQLNNDKVAKELKAAGYILFLTSDLMLTPIEALEIYRNKDVIEKNFDDLKNDLDFHRLKTHINNTTNGKIFVAFIALILRSYIVNNLPSLKTDLKKQSLTSQEVLLELEKIKLTTLNNDKTIIMPLTSTQKKILKNYDISIEIDKALENL